MVLILEDLNLQQLLNSPVSPSIKAYSDERLSVQGPVTKTSKFTGVIYDANKDIAIFKFVTEATGKYSDTYEYKDTNPVSTPPFNLEKNPNQMYDVWIGFSPVKVQLQAILSGSPDPTPEQIKQALNACNVKVWSNSPSFHYQGFNYNLSKKGAALFPTNIPPEQWKNIHGQGLLDKHTLEIITSLPFYMNQFAQALLNKIKKPTITTTESPQAEPNKVVSQDMEESWLKEALSLNNAYPIKAKRPTRPGPEDEESSDAYEFYDYLFSTGKDDYKVRIQYDIYDKEVDLIFGTVMDYPDSGYDIEIRRKEVGFEVALKILATIAKIIVSFVKKHNVGMITFSANKKEERSQSRIRAYNVLAKQLAEYLGGTFEIKNYTKGFDSDHVYYYIYLD